ncbi:uncharacterized protein LOC130974909 [Arachis stenosperma]|uniref:uncharacterized protein LOC130974909 n=1 Tax=Arachis stenosperma TaxID=217475 RepID=UPI0025AC768C|nr:uncharacterized protein LOC130974909 [Arachis stenosperma]
MARMSLDHSAGGSIHMRKTIKEAHELTETFATNQHLYSTTETSMTGEVKAISTEPNPPEQDGPLTQQLHALAQQLLELQEALRETQASNKNVEAQLSQARQQLSKQITEECQAIQLRNGKSLNTQPQCNKRSREEKLTEGYQTAKLRQAEKDKQFVRFADYLRTLEINIPFAETLEQIHSCAMFMKDIFSHKKDWREAEIVLLIEECNAVIQKNLPEKLKDPGSFMIPYTLGDACTKRALCNLGASINPIPISLIKKLCLTHEVKPTRICL